MELEGSQSSDNSYLVARALKCENKIYLYRPDISFDDIGGLEEVKKTMKHIAFFIRNPGCSHKNNVGNVLLYGPHGNGKTLLAGAMAIECGAGLILFDDPYKYICTAYGGPGWREMIKAAFSKASKNTPCIILFEDFDLFVPRKVVMEAVSSERRIILQLLTELNNLKEGVIVIGETRRIDLIDEAILQRFKYRLEVGLPDEDARREIIKIHTKKLLRSKLRIEDKGIVSDWLVRETEHFSGREIKNVIDKAVYNLIKNLFRKGGKGETIIKRSNFEDALREIRKAKSKT